MSERDQTSEGDSESEREKITNERDKKWDTDLCEREGVRDKREYGKE